MSSWYGYLFFYPPPANLTHRLLITARQLWSSQQCSKHRPRVLATAMPENFQLVPLTRLAIERVAHKQLSPHARGDRTVKEVRVVRRAVAKQVSELLLPARPRHVRHDPALAVQFRERSRRVERVVHGRARVVCLVEHGEQDLAVRVDVAAWILVVVRHGLG